MLAIFVPQAADHIVPEVSVGITLFFTGILVALIVSLALEEKLHAKKSIIVGLYAVMTLLLGAILLEPEERAHHH